MKRVTEQLTAYYKSKGLNGAALNSCVKRDLKKVRANSDFVTIYEHSKLEALFDWASSNEGHQYWRNRVLGRDEIAE